MTRGGEEESRDLGLRIVPLIHPESGGRTQKMGGNGLFLGVLIVLTV